MRQSDTSQIPWNTGEINDTQVRFYRAPYDAEKLLCNFSKVWTDNNVKLSESKSYVMNVSLSHMLSSGRQDERSPFLYFICKIYVCFQFSHFLAKHTSVVKVQFWKVFICRIFYQFQLLLLLLLFSCFFFVVFFWGGGLDFS